jgi:hypothetical protein
MPTIPIIGFAEYDSDQIRVTGWGQQLTRGVGQSGLADGLFLEIDPDGPSFTEKRGTDGFITRSKTNNYLMKIMLHVMQSNSVTNGFLSGLLTSDEAAANGAGVGNFAWEDLAGTSLGICPFAWVVGLAPQKFGREADERVWEVHAIRQSLLIGGN